MLLSSFYRWENQVMENVSNLPRVTQLSKWQDGVWLNSPAFNSYALNAHIYKPLYSKVKNIWGTSLVVQWLRIRLPTRVMGSSPGPGRPHMLRSN